MTRIFTTSSQPDHRQLSWWQEILSDVYYKVEVHSSHRDGLRGEIIEHELGELSITSFSADNQRVLRTRPKIAGDDDDSFVLVMPYGEHLYFNQNGRNGYLPPGSYVLVQTKEFYELSCPDSFKNLTVKIPSSLLRKRIPMVEDHCACAYPNDRIMGSIVRDFTSWVLEHYDQMPPQMVSQMATQLVDMIAALLESETRMAEEDDRPAGVQLRNRIQSHVRERLFDSELSPTQVAAAFGISTSYLHRLFRPAGVSFGRWVTESRLQRGYEMLTHPASEHMSIANVAYACGFTNHAHFSTAFRYQFGLQPREARELARSSRYVEVLGPRLGKNLDGWSAAPK